MLDAGGRRVGGWVDEKAGGRRGRGPLPVLLFLVPLLELLPHATRAAREGRGAISESGVDIKENSAKEQLQIKASDFPGNRPKSTRFFILH